MVTRLEDVIQPEVFTNYVIKRTEEKSALLQSGIIERNAEFDALASTPNTLINMPFWNDLDGEDEVITDDGKFKAGKITSSKDVARKQMRGRMWGANGLSAYLSGDDPMGAIADLVSDYWARREQKMLLATLDGVFKASNMKANVLDITGESGDAGVLTGETFIDATQLLGDNKALLTGVMMHSAVESHLKKLDLIETVRPSDGGLPISYFQGHRVIVDDAMDYNTSDLTGSMYLFGSGAIAKGVGSHPNIITTEIDRDAQSHSGEDFLINRNIQLLHPRGVKWTEKSVNEEFPTNDELATGTNWNRVYKPKAIRIVKFTFNTVATPEQSGGTGE
jgi:hypothetical protein